MRGKAINTITRAVKPRKFSVRPLFYASALSAGVLLCAFSAHADERDQLKSIQADIAAKNARYANSNNNVPLSSLSLKLRNKPSPLPQGSYAKRRTHWHN